METYFGQVALEKKVAEPIKMQSAGEKQQFKRTNKMVDDYLISSLENFKALLDFKGKYFDIEKEKQNKLNYRKNYVKNVRVLR